MPYALTQHPWWIALIIGLLTLLFSTSVASQVACG